MGEKTGIAWCDHTFNPWIGCQKVSAGCQNCYAETLAKRYGWVKEWGKDYRLTSDANWKKPIQWAKQAVKDGVIRRVFCASLADVFDENVYEHWRASLWELIKQTENIGGLEWLILTKRPENITTDHMQLYVPHLQNVRMGITCENQEMFDLRVPILLGAWKGKNFISYEPALSEIRIHNIKGSEFTDIIGNKHNHTISALDKPSVIHWIIAGCESGTNARECRKDWIRVMRDQCQYADIPFFLKQLNIDGKLVKEPFLDGRQWLEFPRVEL